VIIATTNELPGYEVEEVLGEVFGLTVRFVGRGDDHAATLTGGT
jgi:uncharacterized protein YbjQ (UPF0145 family)